MPDREKVVGHLYDCLAASKPENMWVFARKDIVGDALALLREQEPVKPERVLGALSDWYHCGVCWADMLDTGDGYRPKYCPQCGRAVKWGD